MTQKMKKVFQDALAWFKALFVGGGQSIEYWDVQYVPVDIDTVAKDLEVDKLAMLNGSKGLPAAESGEVDFPHKKISNYFSQKLSDLHTKAASRLNLYNSRSGVPELQNMGPPINSAAERFQQAAEQRIHELKDELDEQRDAISKASEELMRFKVSHGLAREPQYPESLGIYICFPIFLLGIDIAFNAAVFKDASPTGEGLRGGILMAAMLALFNVVLASILGLLFRFKNSIYWHYKVMGYASGVFLLLYIPANWYVALLRDRVISLKHQFETMSFDEIVLKREQIVGAAFDQLISNPISFSSIESIGLMAIGVVIAVAAAIDGFRSDDPVPGFKYYHRRLQRLRGGLSDIKTDFRAKIADQYSETEKDLERQTSEVDEAMSRVKNFFSLASRLLTVYDDQATDYVMSCDTLIIRYRDENRGSRGAAPVPRYFDEPSTRLLPTALKVPNSLQSRDLAHYESIITVLREQLEAARNDLHVRWTALQNRIEEATI